MPMNQKAATANRCEVTKIKLESNGEILDVKEPTFGEWLHLISISKEPLSGQDLVALCIGKTVQYLRALPATEGLQIYGTCQPIVTKMQETFRLYSPKEVAAEDVKDDKLRQH